MTFDRAFEFSRRINARVHVSDRFKCGGFGYNWYRSLGIPSDDLVTLSRREIFTKYNVKQLLEAKKDNYRALIINTQTNNE
jgi:hypothetical protein